MGELIPCLTSLGSGYDVLNGLYADPASCKISVVDWNKGSFRDQRVGEITYRIPVSVSFHTVNRSSFYSVHGTSSTEYSKSLSIRTRLEGSYNFFSGSLSVDYSSNETSHLANEFTKIHHSCTLYTIILPSIPTFRELLSDEFARDINELTPGDLYRQYGTHIVNSLAVGGRASFTHATDSRKFSSDTSIDVAAQMSYKAIAGSITAEEEVMYRTAIATFRSSSSTKVLTKGGNPAYANDQFPNHIQEWTNSVINYPSLVFVTNSLIST